MHLNGENCQIVIWWEKVYGNGLNIYDSENKCTPGAGLSPPRGNIHVYYHDIQRSFSLIPLG